MFETIEDIKTANRNAGQHWFSKGTTTYFSSRAHSEIYGGKYFVTSEQYAADAQRLYTVREARPNGQIDTIGEFQQFACYTTAHACAKALADSPWQILMKLDLKKYGRYYIWVQDEEKEGYKIFNVTEWLHPPKNNSGYYDISGLLTTKFNAATAKEILAA